MATASTSSAMAAAAGLAHPAGFDFSLHARNATLTHKGFPVPKATSTGTTIVGTVFKDGVVLGADTRATEGPIVADKNCEKIHYIADHIYCCGAGTAADTEFITQLISSNVQLHELHTGRKSRVVTAMTMFKQRLFQYQGHIGAALVLGGYDVGGPQLFTVAPHGSTDKLPYVTMGSGSLAAMAVFESGWKKDMTRDEAIALVTAAIESGIYNDLGSGSNVDVCVIEKSGTEMLRNYRVLAREAKEQKYGFRRGTTAYTKEDIYSMIQKEDVFEIGARPAAPTATGAEAMDTS
ncbi:proteasome core particle subunit beta 2 [Tilletia horrida]|nr:proteasome core particle subunit beta 2 [Tilletia horrida]